MSAYFSAVVLFTIVIVATILLDAPKAKSVSKTSSARGQLKEGASYVVSNMNILVVMIVALAVFTFVMPYNTLMPIMADEVLGNGAQGFGLLLSLAGIGALVGGLTVASFNDIRHKGMLFLISSLA
jgi:predicted MFS family arabinose efflux permease